MRTHRLLGLATILLGGTVAATALLGPWSLLLGGFILAGAVAVGAWRSLDPAALPVASTRLARAFAVVLAVHDVRPPRPRRFGRDGGGVRHLHRRLRRPGRDAGPAPVRALARNCPQWRLR